MNADQKSDYIVWKMGKNKRDQIIYINNGELVVYFSLYRKSGNIKILWYCGDYIIADAIIKDIDNIQNKKSKKFKSACQVFIYSSEKSINDLKQVHSMNIDNLVLLNPLAVLNTIDDEKINEYHVLPLAETGNSFQGIDV